MFLPKSINRPMSIRMTENAMLMVMIPSKIIVRTIKVKKAKMRNRIKLTTNDHCSRVMSQ